MDVIIQSEDAECGLACLAMVSAHFGAEIPIRELRQRHPLSLKGATLYQLIEIGSQMGFSCRPVRAEMSQLSELELPCILHWDLNHFVVLRSVTAKSAVILDPASGERRMSMAEVSDHYTGIALELKPEATFRVNRRKERVSFGQLVGHVRGLWPSLVSLLLLSLGLQLFVLLAPFYMQWVVDQAIISADHDLLSILAIGFSLALLLQISIGLVRGWAVVHLSSRLGSQWTNNVFSHLLRLPLDFFEKRNLGDVLSRMGSIQSIQRTLSTSFVEALIDGLMTLATLSMLVLYRWQLALVTCLAVGIYLVLRLMAFGPLRQGMESQLNCSAKQSTYMLESIRGVQSLKVNCKEAHRKSRFLNLVNDTVNREAWLSKATLGFGAGSQLVFGLERIVVVWMAASLAMKNVFSVGMLIAYLAYRDQFAQRVSSLIDKAMEFRMLRLHGERLADIALAEPEDDFVPSDSGPASSRIEFVDVSFRYAVSDPWVLRNCSFSIEPEEAVAIVGSSGAGKTTLAKLMLGLLRPQEGEIRIGGVALSKMNPARYRGMIGVVMQEDQLFAGSIGENISLFDSSADVLRVQEAAKLAAVHDDIAAMPMGYHSLIGDMGTTLSGGQKQRVVLARALYRLPRILVLDEATSHLDVSRERQVSEAIRKLNLTRVIIAHRPETIASADRVLHLAGGCIRDVSHDGDAGRRAVEEAALA